MPRVSIGVPVYNCERFIRQSVESLLSQTYGDFELVITDNASKDGTEEICRALASIDKRVRYVRNERNLGGPGNFRRVFSLCSGELHKWSTADDYWDPTFIEKCVAVLDRHPDVVACYSKTKFVDASGNFIENYEDHLHLQEPSPGARFIRVLEETTKCHVHLGVVRRAAMMRTSLIGNELASDIRFLAELALHGKFFVLPEYLFFRRFHETSSSWERGIVGKPEKDWDSQRSYYDPEKKTLSGIGMNYWRRYGCLLRAIAQSPIDFREKMGLYRYIAGKMKKKRRLLFQELKGDILRPVA
jgi:glycosyltransferase involved in cell wall biosynthesis